MVSYFRYRDVAEGRLRLVSRSAIRDARTFADCQIGYSQQSRILFRKSCGAHPQRGCVSYRARDTNVSHKNANDHFRQHGKNDFDYFPETGGLIGVVNKGGATLNPDSAKRLIYERLSKSGSTYTFEGVRPVSGSSYPELGEDKELVLGQYIRVVSEAQTANGARAALVWHTNGRSSLRSGSGSGGSGDGGVQEMPEVSSPLKNKDDAEEIFDDNRFGHFETAQDKKGLLVQGYERATPDHFLNTRKNHTTYDSWFAGITEEKIAETPNNDILIQTSVIPWYQVSANLFAGGSVQNTLSSRTGR